MSFTNELRSRADELWQKSFEHPFIVELSEGRLPEDKFIHYVLNDSYYLTIFAQVQSIAASKSNDLDSIGQLAFHAQSTVNAEHALHETFFKMLKVQKTSSFLPAPTAYQYTSHLLATAATGTLGDIIASILPCYWLYWEIGQRYKGAAPGHPIYDKWISTYGDEWFADRVREQIARLDALAETANETERAKMERLFLMSSQYELEFWDMAYQLQKWAF